MSPKKSPNPLSNSTRPPPFPVPPMLNIGPSENDPPAQAQSRATHGPLPSVRSPSHSPKAVAGPSRPPEAAIRQPLRPTQRRMPAQLRPMPSSSSLVQYGSTTAPSIGEDIGRQNQGVAALRRRPAGGGRGRGNALDAEPRTPPLPRGVSVVPHLPSQEPSAPSPQLRVAAWQRDIQDGEQRRRETQDRPYPGAGDLALPHAPLLRPQPRPAPGPDVTPTGPVSSQTTQTGRQRDGERDRKYPVDRSPPLRARDKRRRSGSMDARRVRAREAPRSSSASPRSLSPTENYDGALAPPARAQGRRHPTPPIPQAPPPMAYTQRTHPAPPAVRTTPPGELGQAYYPNPQSFAEAGYGAPPSRAAMPEARPHAEPYARMPQAQVEQYYYQVRFGLHDRQQQLPEQQVQALEQEMQALEQQARQQRAQQQPVAGPSRKTLGGTPSPRYDDAIPADREAPRDHYSDCIAQALQYYDQVRLELHDRQQQLPEQHVQEQEQEQQARRQQAQQQQQPVAGPSRRTLGGTPSPQYDDAIPADREAPRDHYSDYVARADGFNAITHFPPPFVPYWQNAALQHRAPSEPRLPLPLPPTSALPAQWGWAGVGTPLELPRGAPVSQPVIQWTPDAGGANGNARGAQHALTTVQGSAAPAPASSSGAAYPSTAAVPGAQRYAPAPFPSFPEAYTPVPQPMGPPGRWTYPAPQASAPVQVRALDGADALQNTRGAGRGEGTVDVQSTRETFAGHLLLERMMNAGDANSSTGSNAQGAPHALGAPPRATAPAPAPAPGPFPNAAHAPTAGTQPDAADPWQWHCVPYPGYPGAWVYGPPRAVQGSAPAPLGPGGQAQVPGPVLHPATHAHGVPASWAAHTQAAPQAGVPRIQHAPFPAPAPAAPAAPDDPTRRIPALREMGVMSPPGARVTEAHMEAQMQGQMMMDAAPPVKARKPRAKRAPKEPAAPKEKGKGKAPAAPRKGKGKAREVEAEADVSMDSVALDERPPPKPRAKRAPKEPAAPRKDKGKGKARAVEAENDEADALVSNGAMEADGAFGVAGSSAQPLRALELPTINSNSEFVGAGCPSPARIVPRSGEQGTKDAPIEVSSDEEPCAELGVRRVLSRPGEKEKEVENRVMKMEDQGDGDEDEKLDDRKLEDGKLEDGELEEGELEEGELEDEKLEDGELEEGELEEGRAGGRGVGGRP